MLLVCVDKNTFNSKKKKLVNSLIIDTIVCFVSIQIYWYVSCIQGLVDRVISLHVSPFRILICLNVLSMMIQPIAKAFKNKFANYDENMCECEAYNKKTPESGMEWEIKSLLSDLEVVNVLFFSSFFFVEMIFAISHFK